MVVGRVSAGVGCSSFGKILYKLLLKVLRVAIDAVRTGSGLGGRLSDRRVLPRRNGPGISSLRL